MAHFSGDPRLQAAFRDGLDIHQATAAEVFGLPLDQVGGDQRRAAKAINFGLIYGMSAFGLARQLGIARGEAQNRSEEHTSELQSLMRISYAVFCLKKKKHNTTIARNHPIIEDITTT